MLVPLVAMWLPDQTMYSTMSTEQALEGIFCKIVRIDVYACMDMIVHSVSKEVYG